MKKNLIPYIVLLLLFINESQGQTLTTTELSFLKKHAKKISLEELNLSTDWNSLLTKIKNKRIVLLGEFNHGSKEIFQLHNDLIRSLHEKEGFNVILFESGIGELILADMDRNNMTPEQMVNGFFGNWRTKEFKYLMSFVKSENISIAGFDVQRTGGSFKYLLKELCSDKEVDTIISNNIEDRYGSIQRELSNRSAVYDSVRSKTNRLTQDYQNLYDLLIKNYSMDNSKKLLISLKTIANRITYLQYMLQFLQDKDWNKRWLARDSAMAGNIEWLIENFYKNKKIIVIGHNYHISKFNEEEEVMGEFLKMKYESEMYSLGVFASKGSYLGNYGTEKKLVPTDSSNLDIKYVINILEGKVNFINIPKKSNKKNKWLFNEIIVNDSFIDLRGSNKMILSKHFDGLLLIDKVSPAYK